VKDYTLEELRGFEFHKTFPDYPHAQIPTMAEVLDLIQPTGLMINIELKTGLFFYEGIEEKVLKLVRGEEDGGPCPLLLLQPLQYPEDPDPEPCGKDRISDLRRLD
jgi:hypothetical protein